MTENFVCHYQGKLSKEEAHAMAQREQEASQRLAKLGLLEKAGEWLKQNPPPIYWRGTLSEWAELEMMTL